MAADNFSGGKKKEWDVGRVIENDDVERMEKELARDPQYVLQWKSWDGTALMYAVIYGKPRMFDLLLKAGADVHAKANGTEGGPEKGGERTAVFLPTTSPRRLHRLLDTGQQQR